MQESEVESVANLALSAWASWPFLRRSELESSVLLLTGAERMGEMCPREARIKIAVRVAESMVIS